MDFKYLDGLVHSGQKEIFLDSDIVLGEGEEMEYVDGISLDVDGLVIDGEGHAIDACSKARIFHNTACVTIKNVVLKNGLGAIYNFKGVLNISKSRLLDNTSKAAGAAIYNNWGEVILDEVELSGNASEGHAGAIFNVNGSFNIKNSVLSGNFAGIDGGAIYNGSRLVIENSVLSENAAGGSGGAIYDNRGEISMSQSVLCQNSSKGKFGGGAIHKNRGELNVCGCEFASNCCEGDGGAIFSIDGDLTLFESVFFDNVSKAKGGAIYDWGELEIVGCEISDNASSNGGGVYTKNRKDLSLNGCRFEDNDPNDVAF